MKIRRLRSAVLAVALSAGVLAGSVAVAGAAAADDPWPPAGWIKIGPFSTLATCERYYNDAVNSGSYSVLVGCHWFNRGMFSPYVPGFYYDVPSATPS